MYKKKARIATSLYHLTSTIKREKKSNTTARDIKRRLEVITTKMEDLKKLGVPCAFVHVSYWSGGLLVYGDPNITGIILGQAQEMLDELNSCDENKEEEEAAHDHHSSFRFPSLPAPLQELNRRTLECILSKTANIIVGRLYK